MPARRHADRDLLRPAVAIARTTRQTLYDSLYLALVVILKAPLVTADEGFYCAARSAHADEHIMWVGDVP